MSVADVEYVTSHQSTSTQHEHEHRGSDARSSAAQAPTPRDLPAFLPYALFQLQADFKVHVSVHMQDDYVGSVEKKKTGRSKTTMGAVPSTMRGSQTSQSDSALPLFDDENVTELHVDAVHDAQGRLVELAVRRERLPCLLLKLLALSAPHQVLLTRLTLRACSLDALALHQLVQLLPRSNLTDLVLDDSPARAGGYHLLLDVESRLRLLSLDRCALGDAGAAALAGALHHPRPASHTLRVLSLATNGIGDAGAAALGEALRSNRRLQHLNLADNRVTDAGAAAILRSLCEFPVSAEELLAARRRLVRRLQRRREVFERIYAQLLEVAVRARDASGALQSAARRKPRKPGPGSSAVTLSSAGSTCDTLAARAELLTNEEMGPFSEPFGPEETSSRDGTVYSPGNAALCWLNLAYNALGHMSLVQLARVVAAQAGAARGMGAPAGLLRLVLEGNALPDPAGSVELSALAERLDSVVDRAARVIFKRSDRISRVRK